MTLIIAYVDEENKTTYIGADSSGIKGDTKYIQKNPKVFYNHHNFKFLIGFTSSFRMGQILQYNLIPPDIPKLMLERDELERYMVTDFIEEVRSTFDDYGYLQRFEDGDDKGGVFFVAYENKLFLIDGDFHVSSFTINYAAIGCAEPEAMGSLSTIERLNPQMHPEDKIKLAFTVAHKHTTCVYNPYIVLKTK